MVLLHTKVNIRHMVSPVRIIPINTGRLMKMLIDSHQSYRTEHGQTAWPNGRAFRRMKIPLIGDEL